MSQIVTGGLIGYWNTRQGVAGNTWNNIALTTEGMYNATITGASLQEDGILFSGANHRISVSVPTELRTVGNPYTIEILITQHSNTVPRQLFGTGTYTSMDQWGVWYQHYEGNTWNTEIGHSVDYNNVNNQPLSIIATFNPSTKQISYYFNGAHIQTFIATNNVKWAYGNIVDIGYDQYGDPTFQGLVHLLRIYNRALTGSEIQQNYLAGKEVGLVETDPDPKPDPELPSSDIVIDGLVVYWHGKAGVVNNVWQDISPEGVSVDASITNAIQTENGLYFNGVNSSVGFYAPLEFRTLGQPYTIEVIMTPENIEQDSIELFSGDAYVNISTWGLWFEQYSGNTWDTGIGHEIDHRLYNNLTHLTVVYDPLSNVVRYWFDGVLVKTENVTVPIKWTYGQGQVYVSLGSFDAPLKGHVHAIRLYNKPLTISEVLQNFENGVNIGMQQPIKITARITNDGKLLLAGEFKEGNTIISLGTHGDLKVDEIIEGQPFSFKGNKLYVNEVIEGVDLDG